MGVNEDEARTLRTVAEIVETFETRTDPFDPHEVADAVRTLAREWESAGRALPTDMHAEWLAFTLMENYRSNEGFTWETYYGPIAVFVDSNGARIERPGIEEITPEVVAHWRARAHAARQPLFRMRYADLAWEFGRRAKLPVGPELARIAVDATLSATSQKLFKHSTRGFTRLKRALQLALGLRDDGRVISVRDAIIAYEDEVAEDSHPGTWGIAFDELVEQKPKSMHTPPDLVTKLVADLEARLERIAHPAESARLPDGFAVGAAALRLARHYRRIGDQSNMRRVLLVYGDTFKTAAEHAFPMLAMAWLERVHDTYRSFGLRDETEAIEVRLRELGPGAVKAMKPVSTSAQIPAEEVERFLGGMTTGTLEEVLFRIAIQFIPDREAVTDEVHRLKKTAPLTALFTQKIIDREGRPIAEIGSVEEDLDGRVVRQSSQHIQFEIPWLRAVVERMRERLQPTATELRTHLLKSPVFDEGKAAILERGLAAYLAGYAVVAAPVLTPPS
jgi:hypothetical protein